jgi:hypothetical protein
VCPDVEGFKLTQGSKTDLIQRLVVAVEQRRVSWPAGKDSGGAGWFRGCGTDRAAQITRDTGPSASFSVYDADTYPAPPPTPCGRTSLTRSCAGATPDPIRAMGHLGAKHADKEKPIGASDRNSACGAPRRETRRYGSEEDLAGEKDLTAESAKNAERENGDWDVLTAEMKRYEYVISPSGGISYNAPSGYHDDCVIALALANWRRWESESVGSMMRVGGGAVRGVRVRRRGRERALTG